MKRNVRAVPPLVLGLFLALAGCVGVEYIIDPPSMHLELGPPPPPRITRVDVSNGAGKQVMSGRVDWRGEISADPDLADLDGTLTITSTWSDGRTTTQTVSHMANTRVALTYSRRTGGFVVGDAPSRSSQPRERGGGGDD